MKNRSLKICFYQIDAFTNELFKGNPAGVCVLDSWLEDSILQSIAAEVNLSETAFVVQQDDYFELRWFTPVAEVELCGHATLATSYVIHHHLNYKNSTICYQTASGLLNVTINKSDYTLYFPKTNRNRISDIPNELNKAFGLVPLELFQVKKDWLAVFKQEQDIEKMTPQFDLIKKLDCRGIMVTAPGNKVDFVSRFFVPKLGINEDPVTGAAHCALAPFWSNQLNKNQLIGQQLSARGGIVQCEVTDENVLLTGQAVQFLSGYINL